MLEALTVRPRICQQIRSGPLGQWIGCRSEIDAHQAALRGWKGKTLSTGVTSVR